MNVDSFLDTNILVYAVSQDEELVEKKQKSLDIIDQVDFAISVQVLQEFYVTVTRKFQSPLSPQTTMLWVEQFNKFPCISLDNDLFSRGVDISVRYQISYWDGAILAASEIAGAKKLYSEDLNHGQWYESVQVLNPYK